MTERKRRRTPDQIAAEHQRKDNVFGARARKNKNAQNIRVNALIAENLKRLSDQGDPQAVRVLTWIYAMTEDDEVRSALGLDPFANYQMRKAEFGKIPCSR